MRLSLHSLICSSQEYLCNFTSPRSAELGSWSWPCRGCHSLERRWDASQLTWSSQPGAPLRQARRRRVDLALRDFRGGRAGARADVDGLTVARPSRRPGLDVHRPGLDLASAPVGNRIGFVGKDESLLYESHWGSSCGENSSAARPREQPGRCSVRPSCG